MNTQLKFNPNTVRHIFLTSIIPNEPLPSELLVHSFTYTDEPIHYIPKIEAYALITMDEDGIIGHCKCSYCTKSIDLFDKFCSHCGAKLISRKLSGEAHA